jgi:hypothetical protein
LVKCLPHQPGKKSGASAMAASKATNGPTMNKGGEINGFSIVASLATGGPYRASVGVRRKASAKLASF